MTIQIIGQIINKLRRFVLTKKGYSSYYVSYYSKILKNAYKNSPLPKKEKKWAYDRGFFPWRIQQYGLTEENYRNYISDEDYYYLHPLNNRYRMWIDDKLTIKYILSPFDRFLPRYYYHLMKDRGIMRLIDCPQDYSSDAEGVVALLKDKRLLAAKMTAGTYGIGFYKLESDEDAFLVNGERKTTEELCSILVSLDDYVITEFVEMHPLLKKLNPHAVNTVRVMVINRNGYDPIIPFAFMRVGTEKSGIVDNTAQGGMVCKVDVETGRFYDAETIQNHVYQKAAFHPDTNEPLEGTLPNWELIKTMLIKICLYLPQLKWLGFDIAITEDGFSIIEINSHQGLHKANEYPEEVNQFLFSELETKKKRYHIS